MPLFIATVLLQWLRQAKYHLRHRGLIPTLQGSPTGLSSIAARVDGFSHL